MSDPLKIVTKVRISRFLIERTLAVLQHYGKEKLEGLVLWLGKMNGHEAHIQEVYVPDQHPISDEEGLGYFVTGETLFRLNQNLSASGLRLIAQVHSHPRDAYHSEADDRFAIVTSEGGLSLVVPHFGMAAANPEVWAVYRLTDGVWEELNSSQSQSIFLIDT